MIQQKKPTALSTSGKTAYSERFLNPENLIEKLDIKPGMQVAHFGCGNGYFTFPVARKIGEGGTLYALDVVEDKINLVKSQAKLSGLGNIIVQRSNLEKDEGSGIEKESLDWVMIVNMLYQSAKKSKVIEEAKRVLKKGGRILIIDWKSSSGPIGPKAESRVSKIELAKIIKENGLAILKEIEASNFHFGMVLQK